VSLGTDARRHLRAQRHGVLATISRAIEGWPFGSVVPYALDSQARPVILTSRLAEHTKNFTADPRVSLLVQEPGADVQAEARVTLLGKIVPIEREGPEQASYLRYFPQAAEYLQLDFDFYHLEPVTLRVVAGFGKIHWVSREAYAPPENTLAECEADILAHMNADHAHSLRDYCRHFHGRDANEVEMIGIDCDGFDVRVGGALLRFAFERIVTNAQEARAALIEMAKKARGA
jgi:putative heme iron utilization protein